MSRWVVGSAVLALSVLTGGCAARSAPVMVPPQIDLLPHETIGVIQFGSSSRGELGPLATRRFSEAARRDQGLIRIVDLGTLDAALRSIRRDRLDAEAVVALGRKHEVKTIVTGDLAVSSVRPDLRIASALRSGSLSAEVDATLAVQMLETTSGASLWNRSARATNSVASVRVRGGKDFAFDASDPEEAYGGLVDDLVEQVARPFQVSWIRP
jgi:hypothetical protein